MRAKQSSTADAAYGGFKLPAQPAPDNVGHSPDPLQHTSTSSRRFGQPSRQPAHHGSIQPVQRATRHAQTIPADLHGEGLLHDARNLVSAIGLYCDLLSMPGVLKPEHRQYPEELRLLGTRSRVLIEHLMHSVVDQNLALPEQPRQSFTRPEYADHNVADSPMAASCSARSSLVDQRPSPGNRYDSAPHPGRILASTPEQAYQSEPSSRENGTGITYPDTHLTHSGPRSRPISLRTPVERSRGLLSRVANGRPIEVIYGPAADVPVWITEEAIERILVNLVRNACQALDRQQASAAASSAEPHHLPACLEGNGLAKRRTGDPAPGPATIRILVGPLLDRIGETRSWPFQHVRLIVEDAGCGMKPAQLYSLLSAQIAASRGTHGIGFRVVRDLVAASNGDLRAASTPGLGTRVQIEWPVASMHPADNDSVLSERTGPARGIRNASPPQHNPLSAKPQPNQPRTGAY